MTPLLRILPESAANAWQTHEWHSEIADFRLPEKELLAVPNAILTPGRHLGPEEAEGGIYDAQGRYIESARHLRRRRNLTAPTPQQLNPSSTLPRLRGRYLYLGWFFNHYGHFILESFSRCWALEESGSVDGYLFHLHAPRPEARRDYLGFFSLLGLPLHRLHFVMEPVSVDELLVPSQQAVLARGMSPEVLELYPRMAHRARTLMPATSGHRKLYLSRRLLPDSMRKAANEMALESRFREKGYRVVHPQYLSIQQQLSLYYGARQFAGLDGSGLHNVLFSEEPESMWLLGAENRLADAITQVQINEWRQCHTTLILQQVPQADCIPSQLTPFVIDSQILEGRVPLTPYDRFNWVSQLSARVAGKAPGSAGRVLRQLKLRPDEACLFENLVAEAGHQESPDCREEHRESELISFLLAERYLSEGKPRKALGILEKLLPGYRNNPAFLHRYAEILKAAEMHEEALSFATEALALDPGNPPLALFHAELSLLTRGAGTALPLLEELVTAYPAFLAARIKLAEILAKQEQFEAAADILGELLAESPERKNLWPRLTWYLFRAGRPEEARSVAREALQRAPDNPFSRMHLARIHLQLGEPQLAMNWIDKAIEQAPGKPELRKLREQISRKLSRPSGNDGARA